MEEEIPKTQKPEKNEKMAVVRRRMRRAQCTMMFKTPEWLKTMVVVSGVLQF